jgi:catechol 2,3-dioxygenase-like lactoylglutathione lyase family enzyme
MIEGLAFITYPVRDITVARRFYEGILGLKLARSYHEDWFEYDLGDTTFAITSADAEHTAPVRGALIAFEVADLDAEVVRLHQLGVPFRREIRESAVCRYAIVLDPDGSEVMIHRRKDTG